MPKHSENPDIWNRPADDVRHEIMSGTEPATFTDVLDAWGLKAIQEKAADILQNWTRPDIRTPAEAEVAAWKYFRGRIDQSRDCYRQHQKTMDEFTGNPSSISPLNPHRSKYAGDHAYPAEHDTSNLDRENYDIIGS